MHISKQKDKTAIQSNVFENNAHMLPKYYASIERYSNTEGHSEPSQTSEKTLFAKIGSGWKPLTFLGKNFILNAWLGSEYASEIYLHS